MLQTQVIEIIARFMKIAGIATCHFCSGITSYEPRGLKYVKITVSCGIQKIRTKECQKFQTPRR
jgi:hypothetical protein